MGRHFQRVGHYSTKCADHSTAGDSWVTDSVARDRPLGSLYCTKENVAPMPGTAITIQSNGAEYMDVLKQAEGLTSASRLLCRPKCGIQTWREEAARVRPVPPGTWPFRPAGSRTTAVTIRVTHSEVTNWSARRARFECCSHNTSGGGVGLGSGPRRSPAATSVRTRPTMLGSG